MRTSVAALVAVSLIACAAEQAPPKERIPVDRIVHFRATMPPSP